MLIGAADLSESTSRHSELKTDIVLHTSAQLADEVEQPALDAVLLADCVIDAARLQLIEDGGVTLDTRARRATTYVASG